MAYEGGKVCAGGTVYEGGMACVMGMVYAEGTASGCGMTAGIYGGILISCTFSFSFPSPRTGPSRVQRGCRRHYRVSGPCCQGPHQH